MEPLNRAAALACFGDEAIFSAAVQAFLEENDAMMMTLQEAVEARNFVRIKDRAHWIKGGLVFLHAGPSSQAARDLESAGAAQDPERVQEAFSRLQREVGRLKAALNGAQHREAS